MPFPLNRTSESNEFRSIVNSASPPNSCIAAISPKYREPTSAVWCPQNRRKAKIRFRVYSLHLVAQFLRPRHDAQTRV